MLNASPQEQLPADHCPRVSICWVWLLNATIWLTVFLPLGNQIEPSSPALTPKPTLQKSSLEAIAELRGDYRTFAQIQLGNEFIDAVAEGDQRKARTSLAAGADPNARYVEICRYGYTALMYASFLGDESMVGLLLDNGADVNLERNGFTALHFAVRKGHEPIIKRLVEAGARHDPKQLLLTDQLIRAACKGFVMHEGEGFPLFPGVVDDHDSAPSIHAVLKDGADVNLADPGGFTALMIAANLGLMDNVRILIVNGANPRLKAKEGSTALSLAERPDSSVNREGRQQVVEYLRKCLANQ